MRIYTVNSYWKKSSKPSDLANSAKIAILRSLAMKKLTLELTVEELNALTDMASNQLFRKQFIDPKMPGFVLNHEELGLCKNLVGRLRSAVDSQRGKITPEPPLKKKALAR